MNPTSLDDVTDALRRRVPPEAFAWFDGAVGDIGNEDDLRNLFVAAGRTLGRAPLEAQAEARDVHAWTLDDAARVLLLARGFVAIGDPREWVEDLYRFGDTPERRAVLRALPFLPLGDSALFLVEDAIRSNDPRLIAAAVDGYGIRHLDDQSFCHAILKCVFSGIPLRGVEGLDDRATPELARMLSEYLHERIAAGRDVPEDVWDVIGRFLPTEELRAADAELRHAVEERRAAAGGALSSGRRRRPR